MKRKHNKTKATIEAEKQMDALLKRVGYTGEKSKYLPDNTPCYKTDNYRITSNRIPTTSSKKHENRYSGQEIAGLCQLHKSSAEPVRRDNKQAAVDAAQMRRN